MIVEVIYFTHELNMLEAHLEEHQGFVDKFIIKESPVFWTGVEKPLLFSENRERFKKYNTEVMVIPASEFQLDIPTQFPTEDFKKWFDIRRNNRQRSRTYKWEELQAGYDWVFSMDADEIIDERQFPVLEAAMQADKEHIAVKLRQSQYWVNTPGKTVTIYRVFRGDVPHRSYVKGRPRTSTPEIGWHFTNCFNDGEGLYNKAVGISTHYAYCGVNTIPSPEHLKSQLDKGDHPFRDRWSKGKVRQNPKDITIKKVLSKTDRDWAPKLMRSDPGMFPWYG